MRPLSFVVALAASAVVLALAGCGSDHGTQPKNTGYTTLTPTQQQQLQSGIITGIEASVTTMTGGPFADLSGLSLPGVSFVGANFVDVAHRRAISALRIAGSHVRPLQLLPPGCTKTNPANPLDSDADGIPDTMTVTYNCHLDSLGKLDITGVIDVGDPTPTTPDVATEVGVNVTVGVATFAETATAPVTGEGMIAETPGHMTEDADAIVNATVAGALTGTGTTMLVVAETATYDYTGNFLATFTKRIPPGTFNLNSDWQVKVNTTALSADIQFTITTPGGLTVDTNNCFNNPARIVNGIALIAFVDGSKLTITWKNCPSVPTVT